jgi:lipopolysaccharide export system protein LptC
MIGESGMMGGHQVHWLPMTLAALLALVGVWLNQLTHRSVTVDYGGFNHEPDTIVENFSALAFDQAGHPINRLSAARLTHYMDDDTTILEAPHFTVMESDSAHSEVTARRGQISTNGEHVHFLGHVHLVRYGPGAKVPLTLDTEYLWITPDTGIMQTDRHVTLRQGKAVITAGALLANNQSKEVTLWGDVHGIYEKTH